MRDRTRHFVGWLLLLVGALLLGNVLRRAVVESEIALVSVRALAWLAGGAALVFLGWWLERRADPSGFVADPDPGREGGDDWAEEDYVFSDDDLEGRPHRGSE